MIVGFLIVLALVFGFINSRELTIGLELNTFNTPFYKLGIFSERYILEDGEGYEDEIVIGLFVININITFYKEFTA
jgi:hypothetical protein